MNTIELRKTDVGADSLSILQLIESKEIEVKSSCRIGMCTLCKCKLISGKVETINPNIDPILKLEKDEILICNSMLVSNRVILNQE